MIFKKNRFSDSAMTILILTQHIAAVSGEEKARCSHLLAAIMHLAPEAVTDMAGKNIAAWLEEREVKWDLAGKSDKKAEYADEVCVLLLDSTEDSPLHFIKSYFPDRVIGPAELAFIVLKEPTEEISDIIAQYCMINDSAEWERQLCFNYLACCEKHSGKTSRERLRDCVEMGKRFAAFMNKRIVGQAEAIENLTASLVHFWCSGNKQKPLPVLLVSQNGGGKSFFAQVMQEAFVEIGLQKEVYPALDLSCFTHHESADCELLGSDKTYKAAKTGYIYDMSEKNRRGVVVFENIHSGCGSAKQILKALTQNNAYDKFMRKNVSLPFNILLFTLTLSEKQYDFLEQNGTETLDARQLAELLRDQDNNRDFSLIDSMQDFVCLKGLDHDHFKEIIENYLDTLGNTLHNEYQVSLSCCNRNELVNLLLQSFPHEITPKEVVSLMSKQFAGISKAAVKHPEIEKIEIRCGKLPEYPHDISRRTIRGDYLTFDKNETCDGETYITSFEAIKYVSQKSIDCGAYRIERPKNLSLNDIVGLDSLKAELQDALDYITNKYKESNLPPPALGYILTGEPGTGKTATITALASSCDIPVFFANSAVFANANKIDDLFTKAKKMSPAIIVMDELNSIGKADQPWRVEAINTLLAHMDGVEESSKLLVLGSTNYVEQIEVALRRPGRFSRVIKVGLPEPEARKEYIRKFENKYSFQLAESDREYLVRLTEGKTIAVMKGVLEHALRTSAKTGTDLNSAQLETAYNHVISKENKLFSRAIGFEGENNR